MDLDKRDLDNYITREDPQEDGEGEDDDTITPGMAVRSVTFDLMVRRHDWKDRPDPHGVVDHMGKLIEALNQAQTELREYHKVKQALATLKDVL